MNCHAVERGGRHSILTPSLVALLSVMIITTTSHTISLSFSAGASSEDNVQQRFDQRSPGQENARTPVTDEQWYLKIRKTLLCCNSGGYLTDFAGLTNDTSPRDSVIKQNFAHWCQILFSWPLSFSPLRMNHRYAVISTAYSMTLIESWTPDIEINFSSMHSTKATREKFPRLRFWSRRDRSHSFHFGR